MELLADRENAGNRQAAIRLFNESSERYTDTLLRLSSEGQFPDAQTQGVPAAVTFGETDRRRVDTRWTALFSVQNRRAQSSPYFKIVDLYDAVEFMIYQLGERIEMRHVEAAQNIFEADVVAGGLQWNMLWSQWQDLWSTNDGLAGMQAKYAIRQARIAYETLTASGLSTTAYSVAGNSQAENDIRTINAAITEIGNAIYQAPGAGDGQTEEDVEGATYFLLYNPATSGYRTRINRALTARYELPNSNSVVEVDAPVMPIATRHVPAGSWYVALPGRKNIAAIFRDLTIYDFNDPQIAGVADGRIGQGAYKMVRGDSRQVREVATS